MGVQEPENTVLVSQPSLHPATTPKITFSSYLCENLWPIEIHSFSIRTFSFKTEVRKRALLCLEKAT